MRTTKKELFSPFLFSLFLLDHVALLSVQIYRVSPKLLRRERKSERDTRRFSTQGILYLLLQNTPYMAAFSFYIQKAASLPLRAHYC